MLFDLYFTRDRLDWIGLDWIGLDWIGLGMGKIYLFDWGDTLMVDFPDEEGKMCEWSKVQSVEGAEETLQRLSKDTPIFIATNAADSTESDIYKAFDRVDLVPFISGYFCQSNIGVSKDSPLFFPKIIQHLGVSPSDLVMVGDSLEYDIAPAVNAGLHGVWFNPNSLEGRAQNVYKEIHSLRAL